MSEQVFGQITLNLLEHQIGYLLPQHSRQEGRMVLQHGALICGEFVGDVLCEKGSVIITRGARLRGRVEADRIYIEGEVSSSTSNRSILIGRQLVAGGSTAKINADLYSRLFALHKAKIWGQLQTFEEAEAARLLLSANERGTGARRSGSSRKTATPDPGSMEFRDSVPG